MVNESYGQPLTKKIGVIRLALSFGQVFWLDCWDHWSDSVDFSRMKSQRINRSGCKMAQWSLIAGWSCILLLKFYGHLGALLYIKLLTGCKFLEQWSYSSEGCLDNLDNSCLLATSKSRPILIGIFPLAGECAGSLQNITGRHDHRRSCSWSSQFQPS